MNHTVQESETTVDSEWKRTHVDDPNATSDFVTSIYLMQTQVQYEQHQLVLHVFIGKQTASGLNDTTHCTTHADAFSICKLHRARHEQQQRVTYTFG